MGLLVGWICTECPASRLCICVGEAEGGDKKRVASAWTRLLAGTGPFGGGSGFRTGEVPVERSCSSATEPLEPLVFILPLMRPSHFLVLDSGADMEGLTELRSKVRW